MGFASSLLANPDPPALPSVLLPDSAPQTMPGLTIPEDFLGRVEVELMGRVQVTGSDDQGSYQVRRVVCVDRLPGQAAVMLDGTDVTLTHGQFISTHATGYTFTFQLDANSVFSILCVGVDGKIGAFQAAITLYSSNQFLFE